MKLKNFIIHMVLILSTIILLGFFFKRSLILVIQYDGFILILLYILIPMLTRFGVKESLSYYATPFREDASVRERQEALLYFKSMIPFIMLCSLSVSIAVFCYYLGWLDDTLGRFLGTILMTPLYAALISITVFIPFKDHLEKSLLSEQ